MKKSIVLISISTAFLFTSTKINAACPIDMPLNMLEDCIVVEGNDDSFPEDDYENMAQFEQWQQANIAQIQPAAGPMATPASEASPVSSAMAEPVVGETTASQSMVKMESDATSQ